MSTTLVIRKKDQQLCYVLNKSMPLCVDALFPPVTHNYLVWGGPVPEDAYRNPQNYTVGLRIAYEPVKHSQEAVLLVEKADALCRLARAVNRHRRTSFKANLVGQDRVYAMKVEEARRALAGASPEACPMLAEEATDTGATLTQIANTVLMRDAQCMSVVQYTEVRRINLQRRILMAVDGATLGHVLDDIVGFERRG